MLNIDELLNELKEKEQKRLQIIQEQINKGCSHCSQWDEYWGCDKCERV
jgi:hypothetical protein